MTTEQIIYMLTANPKTYAGVMDQSLFHSIISRIKAGTAKPKTVEWFMSEFGYKAIKQVQEWEKKD